MEVHSGELTRGGGYIARRAACAMLAALLPLAAAARADDAEIVLLIGKGDARDTAEAPWRPAVVKQKLVGGSFVRTGEMSQMGLLLRDKTQIRLNQLSILNIRSVNAGAPPPATRLELPQGRAWSQARQRPGVPVTRRPGIEVTMPAGTANIRGTDWELVVEKDGTSIVTVMSGVVDFHNEHGRVTVMPNEQARAVPGKAPVKILLTRAADRVQWVTAYRPQPRRWVSDLSGGYEALAKQIEESDYAPALAALNARSGEPRAALMLADMDLFQGKAAQAVARLESHAPDPTAAALLARAHLVAGDIERAGRTLSQAAQAHPRHAEILLARADYLRLRGDADGARDALRKVLEMDPRNAEAWHGIGRIETEREYVRAARAALAKALEMRPDGPGYQGELGTLETFANEFASADKAFQEALAAHPDDYVALTGLGVLQLKRGETETALESFLKAGVIEPNYARAAVFAGAAFYQLGDRDRALESLARASRGDPNDPLPHLMRSLILFDALELGAAIDAAREAQARMPYLRSLNQVLSDQKGNANVGSALAAFGMEEWARQYAYDSYSPYWPGSHLFLSDRFSGTFNRNSELFKGFLSDPSVFGASNRFSSLVPVPGHYASLGVTAERDYLTDTTASVALNGYSVAWKPFSYSIAADKTHGDSPINRTSTDGRMQADGTNLVLGLGLRPTHELALFAFATNSAYDGSFGDRISGLTDEKFSLDYKRVDAGFNYKFSPTSHAWFKIGTGTEVLPLYGSFFSPSTAATLDALFGVAIFRSDGQLRRFGYDLSQHDIQWRHTFDLTPAAQLSWGLEYARSAKPFELSVEFPTTLPLALRVDLNQDNRIESNTAYASGRFRFTESLEGQLDVHYQDTKASFSTNQSILILPGPLVPLPPQAGETNYREWNPRVGVKWKPAPAQTLRLAGQIWRKPASVSTLAPVDTVGIPLDDRIERDGGRLKRVRLQHEMQFGRSTYFEWHADWKEVKNPDAAGAGVIPDLQLEFLENLRNRQRVYGVQQHYLEDTPDFERGRIESYGLAFNRLLTRRHSLAARYVYADTENTSPAFSGLSVPLHPRHYANVALNWQPYARWVVGPYATYRSSRYRDEDNTERLTAGWSFGLHAYWESADKRLSVGAVLDQLHSDKQSSLYRHPAASLQAVVRY